MDLDRRQGTVSNPPGESTDGAGRLLPLPRSMDRPGDFERAHEEAFGRLRRRVERATGAEVGWPMQAAAAIRAAIGFAVDDPVDAATVTNRALALGIEHSARCKRVIDYLADILAAGRELREGAHAPELLEEALAGGIFMLIGGRLEQGRAAELAELDGEAVEFALTPYLGREEARRVAAASTGGASAALD